MKKLANDRWKVLNDLQAVCSKHEDKLKKELHTAMSNKDVKSAKEIQALLKEARILLLVPSAFENANTVQEYVKKTVELIEGQNRKLAALELRGQCKDLIEERNEEVQNIEREIAHMSFDASLLKTYVGDDITSIDVLET